MKPRSWMWLQIVLAWIAFALFAAVSYAEPVVRDFASVDSTTSLWRLPKDVQFVKVLRGTVQSVVPIAEVKPTDRVQSCDAPTVLPGSTTPCPNVQPDTRDNWRLWAVLSPPAAPTDQPITDVTVTWKHPTDMTDLVGYRIALKVQACDPARPPCDVSVYGPEIDLGLVESYSTSVPGRMFEVCAAINSRAEDRVQAFQEKCSKRELGAAVDLKVEVTYR